MTKLEHALALARKGFWVFPILPWPLGDKDSKGKTPAVKFKDWATREEATIRAWWQDTDFTRFSKKYGDYCPADCNVGVFTSRFGDDGALLVVDVDTKNGKDGNAELVRLELGGFDFPDTLVAGTPTGGRHLFFSVESPVRQGADVLAQGLDVRSRGGYVVGCGSTINGASYGWLLDLPVAPAPRWVVDRCGKPRSRQPEQPAGSQIPVDAARAVDRARRYLERDAPLTDDPDAYKVACRLKDFGVSEADAIHLMQTYWDPRCDPPRTDNTVDPARNAYRYGLDPQGAAAPEADFQPVEAEKPAEEKGHPYDELNKEHAFVIAGGGSHILWETTDAQGRWKLEHLAESAFHKKFASKKMQVGKKNEPITEGWMQWDDRRSFDGLVFMPEQKAPKRFYNLWRGFAVEPWSKDQTPTQEMQDAFDAFLDHARANICRGDRELVRWLLGYFAHLVQRPGEKPLVALVFRGGKGVGKNALVDRVGHLLGGHYLLTSNRRYLVGNFNGHLENCLLFALDEAFWSGDKQAEGTLKDLITGATHVVEHKGKEPYAVSNVTRVAIIGNEDWLVPASHDERRFAVFDVGDGRQNDRAFFHQMRVGMEGGGYRLLLRYLLDYDLTGIDLNGAPHTKALLDQKNATLEPVPQWWLTCLSEGRLIASDFGADWPGEVDCERFRSSFRRYAREHNIRGRVPDDNRFGAEIKKVTGGTVKHARLATGYVYRFPSLDECRASWSKFIGHDVEWSE